METRGRKAFNDRPVKWKLNFPKSLADEVENLLVDPMTGNVHYGARTRLITRLLRNWIKETRDVQLIIKGEEYAAIRALETGRPGPDGTHQRAEYESAEE